MLEAIGVWASGWLLGAAIFGALFVGLMLTFPRRPPRR